MSFIRIIRIFDMLELWEIARTQTKSKPNPIYSALQEQIFKLQYFQFTYVKVIECPNSKAIGHNLPFNMSTTDPPSARKGSVSNSVE